MQFFRLLYILASQSIVAVKFLLVRKVVGRLLDVYIDDPEFDSELFRNVSDVPYKVNVNSMLCL